MYAHPICPHKIASLRCQSRSILVAKHVLSQYIASHQLHSIYAFMVSVPAEDSISYIYIYIESKVIYDLYIK
jgi:ATP-dependent protease ClpP protease subunit